MGMYLEMGRHALQAFAHLQAIRIRSLGLMLLSFQRIIFRIPALAHYPGLGALLSKLAWIVGLVVKWLTSFILPIRSLRSRRKGFIAGVKSLLIADYYDRYVRPQDDHRQVQ